MHYIFFFPDEMRASSLGCYGNEYAQTPNFDRLASEGTLFENHYTAYPVCVASRCSMMTGWYPHVAGFRTLKHYIQPHHPNFLKSIHDADYEVHLYGKNHVFDEATFYGCVDKYSTPDFGHFGGGKVAADAKPGASERKMGDYTMLADAMPESELENLNDTQCVQAAIDAIYGWKPGDKPLFIFLPTLFPHAPYAITEHFHNLHDPDNLPEMPPPGLADRPLSHALIRKYRALDTVDESVFRKIHAVYLGMCSYADMLLGRLLAALDETGLSADSTVIASSDHGDWAGDWGLIEKWPNAMDDDLTRVPLIIKRPGGAKGHRVNEIVQTLDILPTICDWEGIDVRHDHFGVSLAPQVAGAKGDPERAAYCEGGYDPREPHAFEGTAGYASFMVPGTMYYPKMTQQQTDPDSVSRTIMQRDGQYKLIIRTAGDNELYDMLADPRELRNLYFDAEHRETAMRLEQKMLRWLMNTSDVVPWEGHV